MLKLIFWEDEDKKEDGYQYHCCGVDESEVDGILNTWYREANYEIAKEKMLENLKRLRDDIDNLIKKEETKGFVDNNVEKYTTEIKNLIEDAKKNGVDIQLYEKKIGCDNSELVVEKGIAIYTCNTDTQYIPTWKLAE